MPKSSFCPGFYLSMKRTLLALSYVMADGQITTTDDEKQQQHELRTTAVGPIFSTSFRTRDPQKLLGTHTQDDDRYVSMDTMG